MVKGDHIGTDKNTGEEYYTGMIVDDRGEIGTFSPVEYSFLRKGIKVFNHATQDSIVIPKKYHNLKLVKVDSNYKLAFCDKHGNEYRNAKACENKTKNLLYTDDAQEAFTLVDLHSLKGITGKEENLDKIFSIKPTNSKSIISIYDGREEVGSFTNEVGYVNRNKFYFKDSTDFKTYDENRALVIVTKEDGKYKVSLRDGDYIDNDSAFQNSGIQLDSNCIDSYSANRETGEISEIEHSLLFKHEPEGEKIVEFDEYNFTVRIHHDLSADKLQKAIDEIRDTLSEFKILLNLKENDVASHKLELYIHNNENDYRKYTGSITGYGHFDSALNKMYINQSTHSAGNITLKPVVKIAQNHRLLPNKEVLELPEHNLQMNIYHNELNYKQLENIKEEITRTCNDFKEVYGIKESDTTKIFSVYIHDNEQNFTQYGSSYTYGYGVGLSDRDSSHVAYIFHNPNGDNLRARVSFALTFYNGSWDWNKVLSDREELPDTEIQGNELEEDDSDYDDEYVGMQYKIIDDSLHITDSETNDTVKIPKQFKYLRLEEDDEGEYKLALCDKKGHALFDNKKYAKMDDKYKYINTKAVNLDEDIEFDDYDGEDLFSIQPDETNSQVVKILDVYEDEIGMLSNNDFI